MLVSCCPSCELLVGRAKVGYCPPWVWRDAGGLLSCGEELPNLCTSPPVEECLPKISFPSDGKIVGACVAFVNANPTWVGYLPLFRSQLADLGMSWVGSATVGGAIGVVDHCTGDRGSWPVVWWSLKASLASELSWVELLVECITHESFACPCSSNLGILLGRKHFVGNRKCRQPCGGSWQLHFAHGLLVGSFQVVSELTSMRNS